MRIWHWIPSLSSTEQLLPTNATKATSCSAPPPEPVPVANGTESFLIAVRNSFDCSYRLMIWPFYLFIVCSAVNVAYGKPTNQSSTVKGGDSRNANDGDLTTLHENKHCTETKVENSPWWQVDLLQPYEVRVIRILTRGCCGHQPLHDLEIRVGNSSNVQGNRLCAWYPGTLGMFFFV